AVTTNADVAVHPGVPSAVDDSAVLDDDVVGAAGSLRGWGRRRPHAGRQHKQESCGRAERQRSVFVAHWGTIMRSSPATFNALRCGVSTRVDDPHGPSTGHQRLKYGFKRSWTDKKTENTHAVLRLWPFVFVPVRISSLMPVRRA